MRLTERNIKAITPPASGKLRIADDGARGLYLVVTPAGRITFAMRYHRLGRERMYTIGQWPQWNATMAREKHAELSRDLAKGIDPLDERQQERDAQSFRELAELYLERRASQKKTGARDREILERDALPAWGARKAREITRRDVRELCDHKSVHAPVASNRLLACLSMLFNWAVAQELVETNPVTGLKKNPETPRDRVLTEEELQVVWAILSAPTPGVGEPTRTALRLILLTAQRPGEVAGMLGEDLSGDLWTIPAARAKNKHPQRVALTPLACEVLGARRLNTRGPLFPGTWGNASLSVQALGQGVRRLECVDGRGRPIPAWTPHDLRRTAATHMAAGGVPPHVIEALLNHTPAGVTRKVYNLYRYDLEKREALLWWEGKVRELVTPPIALKELP